MTHHQMILSFVFKHQLYQMAKIDKPEICQQYVISKLTNIRHQLDECNMELFRQTESTSISILLPSFDILDKCLKDYVSLQQKYLFKRIENQLIGYKDDIHDQKLYHQLFVYNLTTAQQEAIQQLVHLQQVQLEVYEELIMLKERILHQFLPPIFDHLEQYIAQPELYSPSIADQTIVEMKTKHRKKLQQGKRTILNMYMYAYRFKIKDYEQQYQQALNEFELKFTGNAIIINGMTLFQALKTYMNHRTDRIKQEIMNKISHFRQTIARHRQRSSLAKKTVGVSPQITDNVLHHALNTDELAHLSRGKIFTS